MRASFALPHAQLIDDEARLRQAVARILELEGYPVMLRDGHIVQP